MLVGFPRAEWLSGAPRRRVFKNPETEKERLRTERFIDRADFNEIREEPTERRGSGVVATARMKHSGEAFVMLAILMITGVMQPLVQFRRSGQRERQDEASERGADEGDAEVGRGQKRALLQRHR